MSTRADGRHEMSGLRPGRYTVSATHTAYVVTTFGQTNPFGPGKALDLADGQTIDGVDIALPSAAVISGRVVGQFGDPLPDVRIAAMRLRYVRGRSQLTRVGRSDATTDLGEFRVFGLSPGTYLLLATPPHRGQASEAEAGDRSGYVPTYYPESSTPAGAQPIDLGPGDTRDASIVLVDTATATVRGTAFTTDGRPMTGSVITISHPGSVGTPSATPTRIGPDGTFSFSDLAPGEYVLRAEARGETADDLQVASADVHVAGGQDLSLGLIATGPVTVTGRIVTSDAMARPLSAADLRVIAMPLRSDGSARSMPAASVNDDFTFQVKALPGPSLIRMAALQPQWALRTVFAGGVDVTDTGIALRRNEDLSGLEIDLTNHPTDVSGTVTDVGSHVAPGYPVVVFAADPDRWGYLSRYSSNVTARDDGRFEIGGLPSGDYYAVALEGLEPGRDTDPDFLEAVHGRATRFSLMEGQRISLDLRLVTP